MKHGGPDSLNIERPNWQGHSKKKGKGLFSKGEVSARLCPRRAPGNWSEKRDQGKNEQDEGKKEAYPKGGGQAPRSAKTGGIKPITEVPGQKTEISEGGGGENNLETSGSSRWTEHSSEAANGRRFQRLQKRGGSATAGKINPSAIARLLKEERWRGIAGNPEYIRGKKTMVYGKKGRGGLLATDRHSSLTHSTFQETRPSHSAGGGKPEKANGKTTGNIEPRSYNEENAISFSGNFTENGTTAGGGQRQPIQQGHHRRIRQTSRRPPKNSKSGCSTK